MLVALFEYLTTTVCRRNNKKKTNFSAKEHRLNRSSIQFSPVNKSLALSVVVKKINVYLRKIIRRFSVICKWLRFQKSTILKLSHSVLTGLGKICTAVKYFYVVHFYNRIKTYCEISVFTTVKIQETISKNTSSILLVRTRLQDEYREN